MKKTMNETKSTRGVTLRVMFVAALVLLFAAAGVGVVNATEYQAGSFADFKTAVEDTASDGDTIELTADIQLSGPVTLDKVGTFIIDGAGYTISDANENANFGADGCLVFGNSTDPFNPAKIYTLKNISLSDFDDGINDVVRAEHCVMTIDECTFKGNRLLSSSASSGAVVHTTGSHITIENSVFDSNECGLCIAFNTQGSSANTQTESTITVDNCYFKENTASYRGVIFVRGPAGTIKDSTFENNTISSGGAGVIYISGKLDTLTGCLFKGNSVTVTGDNNNKCGVLSFDRGSEDTAATGNAFDTNILISGNGKYATAYVGVNNIDLKNNYWGGDAPILGDGADIYTTKGNIDNSTYATAYVKKSGSYGVIVSSQATEITYEAAESYTLTIPQSFTFASTSEEHQGIVSLSNVVIGDGKRISVAVSSSSYTDNAFHLKHTNNDAVSYAIKIDEKLIVSNDKVLTVPAGTPSGSATLKFKITGTPKYSGSYKDTLTFLVSVEDL